MAAGYTGDKLMRGYYIALTRIDTGMPYQRPHSTIAGHDILIRQIMPDLGSLHKGKKVYMYVPVPVLQHMVEQFAPVF